jgi:hypothetical protein
MGRCRTKIKKTPLIFFPFFCFVSLTKGACYITHDNHTVSDGAEELALYMNQQRHPGTLFQLQNETPMGSDDDIHVVSSLLQVPHGVDTMLFVSLSIEPSQDDAHTLSYH